MGQKASLCAFALALLCLTAGTVLHGLPADPDSTFTSVDTLATFLVFIFFCCSTLAWGDVITLLLKLDSFRLPGSFAFGTAGAALVAMVLGHLGLVGYQFQMLFRVLAVSGFIAHMFIVRGKHIVQLSLGREHVLILPVIVIFATVLLYNSIPVNASDELYYHLLGPKLWFDASRIYMDPRNPIIMQCSYWEYLYFWAFAFVGGKKFDGLIEVQLFARWLHVALAYFGALLALHDFFKPNSREKIWLLLVIVAAATVPTLDFSLAQAKNDWAIAMWAVSGMTLLLNGRASSVPQLVAAGALLGLAAAGKFTSGLTIAPVVLYWFWRERSIRKLFILATAVSGLITPIAARNWCGTGNPLFPALNGLFHSPWSSLSWQHWQNVYESRYLDFSPWSWKSKIMCTVREVPILAALISIVITKHGRSLLPLAAIGISAFTAGAVKFNITPQTQEHFARLLGPGLLILVGVSVLSATAALPKMNSRAQIAIAGIAAILLVRGSFIPWKIWSEFWHLPSRTVLIREHQTGGSAKAWLRMNIKANERVFSTGDNQLYYVAPLDVIVITQQPEIDAVTRTFTDPSAIVHTLREYGGKYLLNTSHWRTKSWGQTAYRLAPLLWSMPEALAFSTADSDIYDLQILEDNAQLACTSVKLTPTYLFMSYRSL